MNTLLLNYKKIELNKYETLSVQFTNEFFFINFDVNGSKIILESGFHQIKKTKDRELLNLQIELKNLPADNVREICRNFGENLYSEDFLILNKIVIRLTLNEQLTEKYLKDRLPSISYLDEILSIEDEQGEKIILNLNNYNFEKYFDL